MGRKSSRDVAFKLVYQQLFSENVDFEQAMDSFEIERESEDFDFIHTLYHGVVDNFDDLKIVVEQNLVDYNLNRIYKLDLAILLLAVYEIKYLNATEGIVVNEAVELAKKYSTDKSPSFINGVLAKIIKK